MMGRNVSDGAKALEMIPHTAVIMGELNALIESYEALAGPSKKLPSGVEIQKGGDQVKVQVFPRGGDAYGPMKVK